MGWKKKKWIEENKERKWKQKPIKEIKANGGDRRKVRILKIKFPTGFFVKKQQKRKRKIRSKNVSTKFLLYLYPGHNHLKYNNLDFKLIWEC